MGKRVLSRLRSNPVQSSCACSSSLAVFWAGLDTTVVADTCDAASELFSWGSSELPQPTVRIRVPLHINAKNDLFFTLFPPIIQIITEPRSDNYILPHKEQHFKWFLVFSAAEDVSSLFAAVMGEYISRFDISFTQKPNKCLTNQWKCATITMI